MAEYEVNEKIKLNELVFSVPSVTIAQMVNTVKVAFMYGAGFIPIANFI
jgi:hypothetical protein